MKIYYSCRDPTVGGHGGSTGVEGGMSVVGGM